MEDVILRRSHATEPLVDYEDQLYGDQELQIDLHNGEVDVKFKNGVTILAMIVNLSSGVEGAGNYLIFYNDRIVFVSDAYQLGVQQFVEIRPTPGAYTFSPSLSAEVKRTGRVMLKTNFTNFRTAISQNKPTKTKKRSVVIKKERGRSDVTVYTTGGGEQSASHTISCGVVSHPPLPPSVPDIDPIWVGSIDEITSALASIVMSKADIVHTYIKSDGSGIYFYSYYATSGHGSYGIVGKVDAADFRLEAKNTKLTPLTQDYVYYKLSRVGLKTLQKLSAEKPGQLSLRCVSDVMVELSCTIDEEANVRKYYFC